jgi:hypothetical protein
MDGRGLAGGRGVRYPISLPDQSAGRRRTLDEQLFARFPGLYRLLVGPLAQLPPEHRLRRWLWARAASRAVAAANRRDFKVQFLGIDPKIEYFPAGEFRPPDMNAVAYGHSGYEGVWRQMIDSFEDFRGEPEELIDGGDVLLARIRYTGHGSGSGVPIDVLLFQVFRLDKGLVVWQKDYSDRAEAFEAAGLQDQA